MVDGGYCMRLIGQTDFAALQPQDGTAVQVGVVLCGVGTASFGSFRALQIAADRIQFGAADGGGGAGAVLGQMESMAANFQAPDMSSWTFSADMSEDEKLNIQAMLALGGGGGGTMLG
jgi:hypothetical protein